MWASGARGGWWWWRSLISLGLSDEQSKGSLILSIQAMELPFLSCRVCHLHCSWLFIAVFLKTQMEINCFPTSEKHLDWLYQIPLNNTKIAAPFGSPKPLTLATCILGSGCVEQRKKGWEWTDCHPATHPLTWGGPSLELHPSQNHG